MCCDSAHGGGPPTCQPKFLLTRLQAVVCSLPVAGKYSKKNSSYRIAVPDHCHAATTSEPYDPSRGTFAYTGNLAAERAKGQGIKPLERGHCSLAWW